MAGDNNNGNGNNKNKNGNNNDNANNDNDGNNVNDDKNDKSENNNGNNDDGDAANENQNYDDIVVNDEDEADGAVYYNGMKDYSYYGDGNYRNEYYNNTFVSFDSYEVTTVNPGTLLLVITLGVCFVCFFIGYFAMPGGCLNKAVYQKIKRSKNSKKRSSEYDGVEMNAINEDDESGTGSESENSCYYKDMSLEDYKKDLLANAAIAQVSKEATKVENSWKESIDKETGKTFYFNSETLESSWVKPDQSKRPGSRSTKLREFRERSNIVSRESTRMQTMGRQRSVARRKVTRRAAENENSLQWSDFWSALNWTNGRSTSAPARIQTDGYKEFGGDHFEDNSVKENDMNNSLEENDMNHRVWKETKKIIGLGTPWMFQSMIADGSSIITVMIISHYMGLREMICYSSVWFVLYTVLLVNDVWYDTVYKHVNVSAASETEEGYRTAAVYLKVGVVGDFVMALPMCAIAVYFMPDILLLIGYDESVAEISLAYGAISAVNCLFDSATGTVDMVLDIGGHASFTAVYEFWESIVSAAIEFFFVSRYLPSLWQLGVFHFCLDVLSTVIYFAYTAGYKNWFSDYREGWKASVFEADKGVLKKLVKMTAPLTIEAFMGNVEYTVLTVFAAYQGTAEAATWVLLSYVWDIVGIAPDSFGSASSCQVAKLLGKADKELARLVSWESLKFGTAISFVCSAFLFIFRKHFVWCFSLDETIERMLYELIPYIALCQPFFTFGWTAMELNDALHLFKRAMVSNALVTCFIVLPLGYFYTYVMHYNLEGIASAQCIGYTVGGVINIIFFASVDWNKAVEKAQHITNVILKKYDGNYDERDWDDLPIEARAAATVLGYNQYMWDNAVPSSLTDYDNFTVAQIAATKIMGYTRKSYK